MKTDWPENNLFLRGLTNFPRFDLENELEIKTILVILLKFYQCLKFGVDFERIHEVETIKFDIKS